MKTFGCGQQAVGEEKGLAFHYNLLTEGWLEETTLDLASTGSQRSCQRDKYKNGDPPRTRQRAVINVSEPVHIPFDG